MQLFTNNAVSSLASGVNATDNTLVLVAGDGAKFPAITGGDFFLLTLTQGVGLESSWEIVKCTARSGDSLTVVRAQEGTAGQVWAAGSKVDLRVTAGTLAGVQPNLVSGENIKTINGSSLVGAGNLEIPIGILPVDTTVLNYADGRISSIVEDGVVKTIAYNSDETVHTVSWPIGAITRTETFSYTDGVLTGITTTEV